MQKRLSIIVAFVLAVSGTGVVTAADPVRQDLPLVFDGSTSRVFWAQGAALAPSAGSDLATASLFLAGRGHDARTLTSLRVERSFAWRDRTYLRLYQEVAGLRVAGPYAKLAFDASGALIHAVDGLVTVPDRIGGTPAIGPETALRAAMVAVIPHVADRPALTSRDRGVATFARTPAFFTAPTAAEVLLARQSGRLERAWQVTTWTGDDNLLDVTLVDGAGVIAATERRTANESFKIFAVDPEKSSQATNTISATSAAGSPSGWVAAGTQKSIYIKGPNVEAYLDADANNLPDAGGSDITDKNFVTLADLTQEPDTATNRAVAIQNLFYLNNVLHDRLYPRGFTEATGNFQGSDPVYAEAQDGSGTDNANFATPADGSSPRMQMYLWAPSGVSADLTTGGIGFPAWYSTFGPPPPATGLTAPLKLVNDGISPSTGDACESLPRKSMDGKIAVAIRGTCTFVTKLKNIQAAGALGAVVINNVEGRAFAMSGGASYRIPSVMVDATAGLTVLANLGNNATMTDRPGVPPRIDGDLDSDIVYHEYGHGLTFRLIGGMTGPMSGAIGEGASDALAMFLNTDDRIAEYSQGREIGIRTAPYAAMKKDYSSMTGASVHADGEVYGRIAWLLKTWYAKNNLTADDLLDTWVGGMMFTGSGPYMEDMRDGMLAAASGSTKDTETCIIWHAFAAAGVGNGAKATVRRGTITATNSFTVPGSTPTSCSRPNP